MQDDATPTALDPAVLPAERPLRGREIRLVAAALAGGVFTEQMIHPLVFDGGDPGVGVSLLLLVPMALLAADGLLGGARPSRAAAVLLAAAACFAALLAVRSSPTLTAVNLLAAVGLTALAAYLHRRGGLRELAVNDLLRIGVVTPAAALLHPVGFAAEELPAWWRDRPPVRADVRSLLRGLGLAAAPVLVFGALLASADAVFAGALERAFRPDADAGVVFASGLMVVGGAWALLGLIRHAAGRVDLRPVPRAIGHLGSTETRVLLVCLVLLFSGFVIVQFTYLFGGVDTIEATGGLTRAEYARQGFFQLVAVATLVTILVLTLDWWHRPAGTRNSRSVAALYAALIGLTGVMVASALQRMKLYVDAFGLTELRLYTTSFMLWIAALLALLLATVVRGRRRPFALGALVSGLVVAAALNAANPDAVIARVDLERHIGHSHDLDVGYLAGTLSADAVPTIAALLDRIPDACVRHDLAAAVAAAQEPAAGGWRSWRWSRERAAAVIGLPPGDPPPGC